MPIPLTHTTRFTISTGKRTSKEDKPLTVHKINDLKLYGKEDREIESLVYTLHRHTVRACSEDIGMQFGIEKCATIKIQRGIVKNTEGIVLPNAQVTQDVKDGGYRYLGMLEANQIKQDEMKDNGQNPDGIFQVSQTNT